VPPGARPTSSSLTEGGPRLRIHPTAHPVLTLEEAKAFEAALFQGDVEAEWRAMNAAGAALGRAVLTDWTELSPWPPKARLLVLAGKGHNGGDALLAAKAILAAHRDAVADVVLVFGAAALKPLALRAYQELVHAAPGRVNLRPSRDPFSSAYEVSLDGVFGFQFRPPVEASCAAFFQRVNTAAITLRAAVDLPSGLGDSAVLRADFTYATGSVKAPVLAPALRDIVGRLRYLDIDFFNTAGATPAPDRSVLSIHTLDALRGWRDPFSDKRHYGHLFVVGGSRSYPGAVMMTTRAALQSGVGLLTAFVPESLVPSYAAQVPEAMWVGCPETPAGGLALEGLHLLRERVGRATALAIGPGLAREPETLHLARDILSTLDLPAVIDADALQPHVVASGRQPRIVTPHAGEFKRLAGDTELTAYAREMGATVVLKGAPTQISAGQGVYLSLAGGPVLARGGSGDILAGMIAGILAQQPEETLGAACAGTLWHGMAADALARDRGATAVHTTELLRYLPDVLRTQGAR